MLLSILVLLAKTGLVTNSPLRNEGDINLVAGVGGFLFQGDIALNHRNRRDVFRRKRRKWDLPMPYSFDRYFPQKSREVVLEAMDFWSSKTCIKFSENSSTIPHVRIFQGDGCWSFVGRQNSMRDQSLSLQLSCTEHVFVVAHEIAHALGFYHEHSRDDRDFYIHIDYSNIHPNLSFAFSKENQNVGSEVPYEYGSVMHYSRDQFALNPTRPVLYSRNPLHAQSMGNRMRATFHDISRMNDLYNCHALCANTVNVCEYGGYPSPNNCSKCVCPDGFGGTRCHTIESPSVAQSGNPNCGGTVWAHTTPQKLYGMVKTDARSTNPLRSPEFCFWHLKASESMRIEIRISEIVSPCSMSCSFNALEVKLSNFTMTGYRFCCDEHIYHHSKPRIFYSDGPLVVIGAYARYDYLDFHIEYRTISI